MKMYRQIFLIAVVTSLVLTGCGRVEIGGDGVAKLKVVTTIFPLFDIARNVGGDYVDVQNILKPGVSPHTFEITPSDLQRMYGAKAVFMIGQELDEWVVEAVDGLPEIGVVEVDMGIGLLKMEGHEDEGGDEHEHGEFDPHYWLSAQNAKIIAKNIADQFILLDPQNADYYRKNLATFQQEMDDLHDEIVARLEPLENRKMVTFHDAWAYFAGEFDFEIIGVFEPAPGKEASPRYLKELYDIAESNNVRTLFAEKNHSTEQLRSLAEDLELQLAVIDTMEGASETDSFAAIMRENADIIYEALAR